MAWVATAIVGSTLISAGASAYAANKSAGAARDAQDTATAESGRQFDLVRGDTAPYRQAGVSALDKLARLYGLGPVVSQPSSSSIAPLMNAPQGGGNGFFSTSLRNAMASQSGQQGNAQASLTPQSSRPDMSVFFQSPDYQFNLAEGQKAIDRSLVARGRGLSGAGVKEGVRYASGMASNEFGNFYNRLANIAGLGQAGVNTSASAGMNTAANIGNAAMNAGNARASAYTMGAQGVNNSAQGGVSNYLLSQYLGKDTPVAPTQRWT